MFTHLSASCFPVHHLPLSILCVITPHTAIKRNITFFPLHATEKQPQSVRYMAELTETQSVTHTFMREAGLVWPRCKYYISCYLRKHLTFLGELKPPEASQPRKGQLHIHAHVHLVLYNMSEWKLLEVLPVTQTMDKPGSDKGHEDTPGYYRTAFHCAAFSSAMRRTRMYLRRSKRRWQRGSERRVMEGHVGIFLTAKPQQRKELLTGCATTIRWNLPLCPALQCRRHIRNCSIRRFSQP